MFPGNELFRGNEMVFRGNERAFLKTFFSLCPFRASVLSYRRPAKVIVSFKDHSGAWLVSLPVLGSPHTDRVTAFRMLVNVLFPPNKEYIYNIYQHMTHLYKHIRHHLTRSLLYIGIHGSPVNCCSYVYSYRCMSDIRRCLQSN